jgi:hypothetical protein
MLGVGAEREALADGAIEYESLRAKGTGAAPEKHEA